MNHKRELNPPEGFDLGDILGKDQEFRDVSFVIAGEEVRCHKAVFNRPQQVALMMLI